MTPARFLVVLGHSLHVRNFLASGCLDRLAARGHAVTVLMPRDLIAEARRHGGVGSVQALEPIEPYLPGPVATFLRRRFRIASFVQRQNFRTYRHGIRLRMADSRWYALQARTFRALARRFNLEAAARRLESRVPSRRAALALLERARPDLVFCPTLIHDGSETELLKAARLSEIPTAAFAASWDTLTSKGFFLIPPEDLLVWGEDSRRPAIEFHGFAPDRVHVTGAPQLDVYGSTWSAESRDRFLSRRGIDPSKRVILFVGTTISYWEDEPIQLRALSDAVRSGELKDCLIWYRPHPRRAYRDVEALGELHGVYVDDQVIRQKTEGVSSYSTRPEDLGHYRNLMEASEGVIAAFSTMILEAALLGKPSLVVAFGLNDRKPARLIQHGEYEHSLELVATPGVVLCRSLDELKQGVQRMISGAFAPLAPALRARGGQIARNLDGGARARIVETLERLAARTGQSG